MTFKIDHTNINALDFQKSYDFYTSKLGLKEIHRKETDRYIIAKFRDSSGSNHEFEITHLKDRKEPYDLSDNEIHIGFRVDDYASSLAKHQAEGIVNYVSEEMGIYFIVDPDGY
ncbi:unnamed protein product [Didymodactylos carnosus]|uniref:VOC domain-containing protein n=1 Tax=Didymodactylos carnosus TaxID=1234261 RepID=A0A8S2FQF4_9BILA|nr:unnamed protein product [Didymodactylos carnosus]CAF4321159.1 unnamed protein product [Didymodactylos carnosus]